MTSIPLGKIINLSSFGGQPDVLKAMTFLPGVSNGKEGYANLYVRGSNRDRNLILLDGATIYSTNHVAGFFSLFNTEVIKDVDLYKGGFPARYGGRTGSVLDIRLREGDYKKVKGHVNLGLFSSGFSLEGPFKKDKSSFLLAARSSYAHLIMLSDMRKFKKTGEGEFSPFLFYDINARINHRFSDKFKAFVNFYKGHDTDEYIYGRNYKGYTKDISGSQINNYSGSAGLQAFISPKWFHESLITYTNYQNDFYEINHWFPNTGDSTIRELNSVSALEEYGFKNKSELHLSNRHTIIAGLEGFSRHFNPYVTAFYNKNTISETASDTVGGISNNSSSLEVAAFVEDDYQLNEDIKIHSGLRLVAYKAGKWYRRLEPRLSLRWNIKPHLAWKSNATVMHQFTHVLVNTEYGMQREIWLNTTENIPPQRSWQISSGLFGEWKEKGIEYGAELYAKKMNHVIRYIGISDQNDLSHSWEEVINTGGKGRAYGLEISLQKHTKKYHAMLSYTLSRSERQFDELNKGAYYPFEYDRTHDINLNLEYQLSEKYSGGGMWIFQSGIPVTLPDAFVPANPYFIGFSGYEQINNYRMPAYHRLDVFLKRTTYSKKNKRKREFSVNIYNLYARKNAQTIFFEDEEIKKISFYSIFPTVNYRFEF